MFPGSTALRPIHIIDVHTCTHTHARTHTRTAHAHAHAHAHAFAHAHAHAQLFGEMWWVSRAPYSPLFTLCGEPLLEDCGLTGRSEGIYSSNLCSRDSSKLDLIFFNGMSTFSLDYLGGRDQELEAVCHLLLAPFVCKLGYLCEQRLDQGRVAA
jgi:hypothetical protein